MRRHFARLATISLVLALMMQTSLMAKKASAGGIKGTIQSLGSSGFVLAVTSKASVSNDGSKTLDVLCNLNTKFYNGKNPASPSDIKEGLTVSVVGAVSGPDQLTASSVTIDAAPKKSK
jgi:hypothetical protein